MITEKLMKEVKKINEMSVKCQGNVNKNNEFLLKTMKEHASEIEELFKENDPHYQKEAADMVILALELLNNNNVNPNEPIKIRLGKFKEKIRESMK